MTDSNLNTWTTTITDVVTCDEGRVIVRNSTRPGTDGADAGHSEEPGWLLLELMPSFTPVMRGLAPVLAAGSRTMTPSAITSAGIEPMLEALHDKNRPPTHARERAGHGDPAPEEACRHAGQGHS